MKKLVIAIDVGDTLLDRSMGKIVRMESGRLTYPTFPCAIETMEAIKRAGHKMVIISKIDPGAEAKVTEYLVHHQIRPDLVDYEDLVFCYDRAEKGPIAKRLGVDVIIDDRVQVHNSMAASDIPHRILFLGGHDDRDIYTLTTSVLEARSWMNVFVYINNLSQQ